MGSKEAVGMMRRMSADNHRGQEGIKLPEKGRIYESNDFFSHQIIMSCKRSGSIYAGGRATQEAKAE